MESIAVGWTTLAKQEDAEQLASKLLEAGLVACVQVDAPTTSHYRWKGKLACEQEFRLWLKFPLALAEQVGAFVKREHPYEEPQWLCVAAEDALPGYADWVRKSCSSD